MLLFSSFLAALLIINKAATSQLQISIKTGQWIYG
jgi:hypothetical protein